MRVDHEQGTGSGVDPSARLAVNDSANNIMIRVEDLGKQVVSLTTYQFEPIELT